MLRVLDARPLAPILLRLSEVDIGNANNALRQAIPSVVDGARSPLELLIMFSVHFLLIILLRLLGLVDVLLIQSLSSIHLLYGWISRLASHS